MFIRLLASLVAQSVKNLPAMQKTQVRFLGLEDPVEKEMANHSSILAWRIPWTEEAGWLQSIGLQRVRHDLVTKEPPRLLSVQRIGRKGRNRSFHHFFLSEGNCLFCY